MDKVNYLITCGISQLAPLKIKKLGVYDDTYQALEKRQRENRDPLPPDYIEDPVVTAQASRVVDGMREFWEKRQDTLGQFESPFGAEIATLVALERQASDRWPSPQDHFTLLVSGTRSGAFAARILATVLTNLWDVPQQQITPEIVQGLTERPNFPDQAIENLALALHKHIRPVDKQNSWRNVIVMSGGFKSSIPCLTVFSLLFGLEMVYIFEQSDQLQSLHPRYNIQDSKALEIWRKTWEQMEKQGWAGDQASPALRIALQARRDLDRKQLVVF